MGMRSIAALFAVATLCGCGTTAPKISEFWDRDIPPDPELLREHPISASAQIEFEIKKRIFCELRYAVQEARRIPLQVGSTTAKFLPDDWGALVSLSLTVDETIGLNPGITLNHVLPNATRVFGPGNSVTVGQSFNLGLGAGLSSKATTIEKFDSFYKVKRLAEPVSEQSICNSDRPANDPFV
jgi:hypothetical protein